MSIQIVLQPHPVELPDPPRPADLSISYIARRARVSLLHAAVIAQLAGLGPREARHG